MGFAIKDNLLLIPNPCCLPPICVRTGQTGGPLIPQVWTLSSGILVRAQFGYYISPAAKAAIDQRLRADRRMALKILGGLVAFIVLVTLKVSPSLSEAGGSLAMVAIMALPVGLMVLMAKQHAETSAYIFARLSATSFGFGTDRIIISGLSSATIMAMIVAGPSSLTVTREFLDLAAGKSPSRYGYKAGP